MASRYDIRKVLTNDTSLYAEFFEERNVNFVNQYTTPKIIFMDAKDRANIVPIYHTWRLGDRYYKLADRHYDDATYWWVIGWYNQYPLESDVKLGTVIVVPTPLDSVLTFFYRSN